VSNIIVYEGNSHYIHSIKNYEDVGSCAYAREYKLVPCNLEEKELIYSSKDYFFTLSVNGATSLPFEYHPKYKYVEQKMIRKGGIETYYMKRKKLV